MSSIAGLCLAALVFSYLGALHPAGDLVAIAAPALGLFGLFAAGLLWGRAGKVLTCVFAVLLAQHG
ncbi:hypothetical protein AIOL_004707 [Candidatus Rhodobacter oscarellae]|uniref:Uncharacterized protein n=1 Tax=Candidatus Rhodobacter oscarellae TaxID=1675527 RepID=A0A0J9EDC2_9RHOB|nr:hypothetical protein AIOL_004707 [Candidatus Rhodobacter lobularis]